MSFETKLHAGALPTPVCRDDEGVLWYALAMDRLPPDFRWDLWLQCTGWVGLLLALASCVRAWLRSVCPWWP
jgi:hypothetical protein